MDDIKENNDHHLDKGPGGHFGWEDAEDLGIKDSIKSTIRDFKSLNYKLTGPILHGSWAGVVGWFIAVAALQSGKKLPIIAVGIAYMALLHGLYDVFAGGLLGVALACFSFLLFMNYLVHGDEEKESYFKK